LQPTKRPRFCIVAVMFAIALVGRPSAADEPARAALQPGDRIAIVGNTFAERMRHFGYFETHLTSRHPELGLTFRNLGWSADEVDLQPRPMDFGNMDAHLHEQQASVIFLSFGFNESFQGEAALPGFIDKYKGLITHLAATTYDGREPARPVIIGPMLPEPLPGCLPTPDYSNLAKYSAAIETLAQELGVPHIDLHDTLPDFRANQGLDEDDRFTFNGIHLVEFGDYHIAQLMAEAIGMGARPHALMANAAQNRAENFFLGVVEDLELTATGGTMALRWDRLPIPARPGSASDAGAEPLRLRVTDLSPGTYRVALDGGQAAEYTAEDLADGVTLRPTPAHAAAEALRQLIIEKNTLFFDRWRAVNGFYIYGGRKQPFGIESFPPEMDRFDELVLEFEQEIQQRVTTPVRATLTIEAVAR